MPKFNPATDDGHDKTDRSLSMASRSNCLVRPHSDLCGRQTIWLQTSCSLRRTNAVSRASRMGGWLCIHVVDTRMGWRAGNNVIGLSILSTCSFLSRFDLAQQTPHTSPHPGILLPGILASSSSIRSIKAQITQLRSLCWQRCGHKSTYSFQYCTLCDLSTTTSTHIVPLISSHHLEKTPAGCRGTVIPYKSPKDGNGRLGTL